MLHEEEEKKKKKAANTQKTHVSSPCLSPSLLRRC